MEILSKLADALGCTVDQLLKKHQPSESLIIENNLKTSKDSLDDNLNERDKRDIAKNLNKIMSDLDKKRRWPSIL